MVFVLKNKIVIITGGASGIGLAICKVMLRKGVQGVCLADINIELGEEVTQNLNMEFGEGKVIFVKTDVVDTDSFENVFKVTLSNFGNIDILINNAGILNDKNWSLEVDINLKGMLNGMILGLDKYLRLCKQDEEAVILNTSSIFGTMCVPFVPVYASTKHAVMGLTRCWGHPVHYNRSKVRVVAVCPGLTETRILSKGSQDISLDLGLDEEYEVGDGFKKLKIQSAEFVGEEAVKVVEKAPNGTFWVIENSEPTYQYFFSEKNDFKNFTLE
ncbi:15-hydroxyprostaglandin dehydrogenase [NAD(+)]-like isoform X1 [Diorhabda sublineata]|uniref:15-hydroxyprostaglandin dehydrogenase [NAD(+)]-like isoform X1 n=1 Tax=Diorhabda sublineata TaxID=1163346 RepID=UPI0024E0B754|nr:15-hydroxyprostaglandin dehydrogenase [NAD(+)]-like isoform X1 [Diorhabda sublineata]